MRAKDMTEIHELIACSGTDSIPRHASHTVQQGIRYLKRVAGAP